MKELRETKTCFNKLLSDSSEKDRVLVGYFLNFRNEKGEWVGPPREIFWQIKK